MLRSLMVISLFFIGCNPVKKVLQSPEKTQEVVAEYVKRNPQKNDTTYLPGDTVTITSIIVDSVPLPYPVNHKYTETRYIDRTITDTVKVIDRTFIDALSNRLKALEVQVSDLRVEVQEWKSKAQVRLYWLIGLITAIVGAGVFYVIRTFQPKITIGK